MQHLVLIDITQTGVLFFSLLQNGVLHKQKRYRGRHPDFLASLEKFLKYNKLGLEKINALALLEGGGTFSGVRQAVAILNMIYLIKKVNIFGLDARKFSSFEEMAPAAQKEAGKKHGPLLPIYNGEPNITYSRQQR